MKRAIEFVGTSLVARLTTCAVLLFASACGASNADNRAANDSRPPISRETTVGMPARIEELVIPGAEIAAAPADAKSPIVLRITRSSPHGSAHRYDLEYTGLDPGEYDLRGYLRRADGSRIDADGSDVPPILVTVRSSLAAGAVKPHAPDERAVPSFGGYRTKLIVGGSAWMLGFVAIVALRRKRLRDAEAKLSKPRSLAERLRPLVERARAGSLTRSERAELELGLVAYWRKRLALEKERPEIALEQMRAHPEAGRLLRGLEDWLHRPPARGSLVDVDVLLAPYVDLPADALDAHLDRSGAADVLRSSARSHA